MQWNEITIASNPDARLEVERVLMEEFRERGFPEDVSFSIKLAMEEAIVNAMKHGNNFDESKQVLLRYGFNGTSFHLVVRDEGDGFDYRHLPDPTDEDHISLPYGRGIMLMKTYMDSVTFSGKGNEVTMVKSLHPEDRS